MQGSDIQDIIKQEQERLGRQQMAESSYRRTVIKRRAAVITACIALLAAIASVGIFISRHVQESQAIFDTAEKYANDSAYISAVHTFGTLGKGSLKHEDASVRIQELYNAYYDELLALITDCMKSGSNAYVQPLQEAAEDYYTGSKEMRALQKADSECGNPLVALISNTISEHLGFIERIEDQPGAKCANLRFSLVNGTALLIAAYYQNAETGESFSCYYEATSDNFRGVSDSEYNGSLEAAGLVESLDVPWAAGDRNSEKEETIYTNLVLLAQAYRGEITIEDAQEMTEEEPPEKDHDGLWNLLLIVALSVGVVVYSVWVLRSALKFMLGR